MHATNSAPPTITGVDHITLPITDLGLAERFYVELLGLRLTRRVDREAFARRSPERADELARGDSPLHLGLRCGDVEIDLFFAPDLPRRPLRSHPHLALRVDPRELDAHHARLRGAGVAVDGPRRLGPPGQASLYFTDPFGNLLELCATGYEGATELGPPRLERLGAP
ncbi:MAG: VOC family protein [Myxococcales bacterium]|nr:VOC family protein [Myxococcales bacterium]